jgi:hypothetical protein
MLNPRRLLTLISGAVLFAAAVLALLSAPGFLSDIDSTVPNQAPSLEARR